MTLSVKCLPNVAQIAIFPDKFIVIPTVKILIMVV